MADRSPAEIRASVEDTRRELQYSPERYTRAVFMEPENFTWVSNTKLLGVFNERGTKLAFHRIDSGAIALLRLQDAQCAAEEGVIGHRSLGGTIAQARASPSWMSQASRPASLSAR